MNYNEFKQAVIEAAKEAGLTEYELYYSMSSEISTEIHKEDVKSFSSSKNGGACFRCIVDGKMGYAATEKYDEEEAKNIIIRAMDNALSIESEDEVVIYGERDTYKQVTKKAETLPSADLLIEKAIACNKATYEQDSRVIDATESGAFASTVSVSIYNSKGLDLNHEVSLSAVYTEAVIEVNEEMLDAFDFQLGNMEEVDVNKVAKKAVEGAVEQIGAIKAASGKTRVLFSEKMMATMLSTFSEIFSAENAQKGLSLLQGKENTAVASEIVTIVDDPFYSDSTLQMPFDAEGVATYTKEIVKDGMLNTLLYNLKTAKKAGIKSTGNASKLSYSSSVSIRPYYFYMKPGSKTKEELFTIAGDGLYITELQGMHAGANPTTGDFSLGASGFLIKDGKKESCVKGFTVAGNFYKLLQSIEATSNELEFILPRGLSSFGSPCVLVSELSIAG